MLVKLATANAASAANAASGIRDENAAKVPTLSDRDATRAKMGSDGIRWDPTGSDWKCWDLTGSANGI
jgi:hypothetical protein